MSTFYVREYVCDCFYFYFVHSLDPASTEMDSKAKTVIVWKDSSEFKPEIVNTPETKKSTKYVSSNTVKYVSSKPDHYDDFYRDFNDFDEDFVA